MLRRSSREKPSKKAISSPSDKHNLNKRKSGDLNPLGKRKSERDMEQNTPSSLRRSTRSKTQPADTTRKKEETDNGVTLLKINSSKCKKLNSDNIQVEKKRRDARIYARLFIIQKKRNVAADPIEQLKQQDELPQPDSTRSTIKAGNELQTTGPLDPGSIDRSSDGIDLVGGDNITPSKTKKNVEAMDFDSSAVAAREDICVLNLSQHEFETDSIHERCVTCFKKQRLDLTFSEPDLFCSCKEILDEEIGDSSVPKANAGERLNIPCLLENGHDTSPCAELRASDNDEISLLKERLSQHIADECKSDSSRFAEYWVPVRISNLQIEQYCDILYSNAMLLRTCTNKNLVGALREILTSVRKCCDHPYLLDSSLEPLMIKDLPATEYLDVGVKISGKLQLLDKMLLEIKNQNRKALILYQAIGEYGKDSTGNYLDDFLHRKFGPDSYERVDKCMLVPSKKQAALDRFNNGNGRFVFLLENRACHPSIKLLSVDCIIIFDSDWNPVNDLRSLQKITINSNSEKIKLFRLYSSCTVEEKVLILAKQGANLDGGLRNININTSHMLLMWGALNLSNICDELHNEKSNYLFSNANLSLHQSIVTDVIQEITAVLLHDLEDNNTCKFSKILRVQQNGGGSYIGNGLLLSELELQHSVQEAPQVFWTKLLEGKKPRRECFSDSSLRNRKRVHCNETSVENPTFESNGSVKKSKKVISKNIGTKPGVEESTLLVQGIAAHHHPSLPFPESAARAPHADNSPISPMCSGGLSPKPDAHLGKSKETETTCSAQKKFHLLLMSEILELCKILKLKEDAKCVVERLLQYILDHHHVDTESASTLHAFQLALCWVTADLMKHDIDKKDSLAVAKQHLKFDCKQEVVQCIYSMLVQKVKKLKELKKLGGNGSYNVSGSPISPIFVIEDAVEDPIRQDIPSKEPSPQKSSGNCIDSLHLRKQYEEVTELLRIHEEEKTRLKKDCQVEMTILSSIHPSRIDKLKTVEETYEKKLKEHSLQMGIRLQNLKEKLMALNDEEMTRGPLLEEGNTWPEIDSLGKVHWKESAQLGEHLHNIAEVTGHSREGAPSVKNHLSEEQSIHCDVPTLPESRDVISNREHSGQYLVNSPSLQPVPSKGLNEGVSTQCIELDYEDVFTTEQIFKSRHDLIAWTKKIGRKHNMSIVISKSDNGWKGHKPRLVLGCGRSVPYNHHSKSVKYGVTSCPFKLRAHKLPSDDEWMLKVVCGVHNHEVNDYHEGHYSRQSTTEQQAELVEVIQLDPMDTIPSGNHEEPVSAPPVHYNLQAPIIVPVMQSDQEAPPGESDVLIQPSSFTDTPATLSPTSEVQTAVSRCAAPFVPSIQNAPVIPVNVASVPDQSTNEAHHVGPVRTLQSSPFRDLPSPDLSRPDLSSTSGVNCATGSEWRGHPPNTQDHTTLVENMVEPLNQTPLQPAINISLDSPSETLVRGPLSGPRTMSVVSGLSNRSIQTTPTPLSTASRVPQPRCLDPLQHETERILKETEEAIKIHKETKLHLKSNCEKEIEEVVAQIRAKYETMLGDANTQFLLKKQELEARFNKVHIHKMLAVTFSANMKLSENEGTMLPLVQPSSPRPSHHIASPSTVSTSGVNHHIVSPPEPPLTTRSSAGPSVGGTPPAVQPSSPMPNHPIVSPSTVSISGVNYNHPIVSQPEPPLPFRSSVDPPVGSTPPNSSVGQVSATFHKSRLSSSVPTRPLHISNITPSVRNVQIGSEVRSRAPHLQPFRPSLTSTNPPSSLMFPPQGNPNQQAFTFPPNSVSTLSLPSVLPLPPPSTGSPNHQPW